MGDTKKRARGVRGLTEFQKAVLRRLSEGERLVMPFGANPKGASFWRNDTPTNWWTVSGLEKLGLVKRTMTWPGLVYDVKLTDVGEASVKEQHDA